MIKINNKLIFLFILTFSVIFILNAEFSRVFIFKEYYFKEARFKCSKCNAILLDNIKSGKEIVNNTNIQNHQHDWKLAKYWYKFWMWSDYLFDNSEIGKFIGLCLMPLSIIIWIYLKLEYPHMFETPEPEEAKLYRSKVDILTMYVVSFGSLYSLGWSIYFEFFAKPRNPDIAIIYFASLSIIGGVIVYGSIPTEYVLKCSSLLLRSGFQNIYIPLSSIISVYPHRSYTNSFAYSFDRVRIEYQIDDRITSIDISPKDKKKFMEDLVIVAGKSLSCQCEKIERNKNLSI